MASEPARVLEVGKRISRATTSVIFMGSLLSGSRLCCETSVNETARCDMGKGVISTRPAAVDDVDLAGGEGGFVGGQVHCESGDLLRPAQPGHRLPGDKGGTRLLNMAQSG